MSNLPTNDVCIVPTPSPPKQPDRPTIPTIAMPSHYSPHAVMKTLAGLIQAVRQLAQQIPDPNLRRGVGAVGGGKSQGQGRYIEVPGSRVTEKIKVTNPNDPDQFVEIERINKLNFKDTKTGETWTWSR